MTGHTPTRLLMTESGLHPAAAIEALLEMLKGQFSASTKRPRNKGSDNNLHAWGNLMLGDTQVSIDVYFLPTPSQGAGFSAVILLGSAAYESAYDLLRRRAPAGGKQALIRFCTAAASALQVEGFCLEFADDRALKPFTTDDLLARLTALHSSGLAFGLRESSPSSTKLRTYWPQAVELDGYLIVEFLGR